MFITEKSNVTEQCKKSFITADDASSILQWMTK